MGMAESILVKGSAASEVRRVEATSQSDFSADTHGEKAPRRRQSTEMRKAEFTSSDSNEDGALAKANNEIATPTSDPPKSPSADIPPFRIGSLEPLDLEKV